MTLVTAASRDAAWARGDRSSIESAHPEIEFVIADGPAPGRWTGMTGMAKGFRELVGGREEWRPKADEYREHSRGAWRAGGTKQAEASFEPVAAGRLPDAIPVCDARPPD